MQGLDGKGEVKQCPAVRGEARMDADTVVDHPEGEYLAAIVIQGSNSPRSRRSRNELGMDGKRRRRTRKGEG